MTDEVEEKTPEWLLRLESRKRKPRLAHDIGAGAPCLTCGDACPGLDLHFWRKLCRNCKCKKEEHDVKDDDGYEQFEILLGAKKRKLGGVLKFRLPDAEKPAEPGKAIAQTGNVKFDWVPPDVSDDVASEYMRQIPVEKLPITGSDGAVYRRQQLEKQMPLHDLDASKCHNLSAEEIEGLMQYLNNLKNNVVGQGKVTKVPVLFREYVLHNAVPHQSCGSEAAPVSSAMTSSALQPSQPPHLRSLQPSFNAAPRPFHPSVANSDSDFPPPPPPDTENIAPNASTLNLKMPSAFVPQWKPSETGHTIIPYNQGYDIAHSTEPSDQLRPSFAKNHNLQNTGVPLGREKQSSQKPGQENSSSELPYGPATKPDQTGTSVHKGNVLASTYPHQVQHSSEISGRANPLYAQQAVGKAGVKTAPEGQSLESIIAASKFPSGMPTSENVQRQFPQQAQPYVDNPENVQRQFPQRAQPYVDNHFRSVSPHAKANIYSDVSNQNVGAPFPKTNLNDFDTSNFPSNLAYLGSVDREGNPILPNSYLKEDSHMSAPHKVMRDVPPFPKNVAHSEATANSAFPQYLACSCTIPTSQNTDEVLPLDPKCSYHHPQEHNDMKNTPAYQHPQEHNSDMRNTPAFHHPHEHNVDMRHTPAYPSHLVQSKGYPSQMAHSQGPFQHHQELHSNPFGQGNKVANIGAIHEPVICSTVPESALSESVSVPHGIDVAHSTSIGSDGMPKSAHVMKNDSLIDKELAEQLTQMSGLGGGEPPAVIEQILKCQECRENIRSGDVAVFAERADSAPWHPQCFVCHTCKELLVDLMYFYYKDHIYCGRHYADLLHIPRCFACDELIFVKEYTMAEDKAFHVKHFCCYECDVPLGGMKYIVKDEQPVCLDCYQEKYGKRCHTCEKMIAAGDQRVTLKELNWHATAECFCCHQCKKSLLGGKMVVKQERPFCSKECVQLGLSS